MAEQSGQSIDAMQSRSAALSGRRVDIAEADNLLAAAVSSAHAISVGALAALDRIEADIETAVADPSTFALDTTAGARALQRFLLAKHREIIAVVTDAQAEAAAKTAAVQELQSSYGRIDASPQG